MVCKSVESWSGVDARGSKACIRQTSTTGESNKYPNIKEVRHLQLHADSFHLPTRPPTHAFFIFSNSSDPVIEM